MMHGSLLTDALREGVRDYRYLLERGYSEVAALKLVGDRRQLDTAQRTMLYRGVSTRGAAAARRAKLVAGVAGSELAVDGLNVIYTIANYLYGRPLFIADDGLLRDAGEIHGRDPGGPAEATQRDCIGQALGLLMGRISLLAPGRVVVYLDEQVSRSGELAASLRRQLRMIGIEGDALTVQSADYALKRATEGVVASSDSIVVDAVRRPVHDLARSTLEAAFAPQFIDFGTL